jgi:methionyl-tRNA formyltransferase
MRLVLFGIYQIGVEALESLMLHGVQPLAVVTKPGSDGDPQPMACCARKHGLPLLQPDSPKDTAFVQAIAELSPELIAVAGYHKIIPNGVLELPALGTINLHGSLLPRYRGPNTWKWAIINGESATGVTVHRMTQELDQGEILAQQVVPISDDDTAGTLFSKISLAGAGLLSETVLRMAAAPINGRAQEPSQASYYGYPSEEQTEIIWGRSALTIRNLIRGVNPSPGAWTTLRQSRVRIWEATIAPGATAAFPGQIVDCGQSGLRVATATKDLIIHQMSLDGEGPRPVADLVNELRITCSDRLRSQELHARAPRNSREKRADHVHPKTGP